MATVAVVALPATVAMLFLSRLAMVLAHTQSTPNIASTLFYVFNWHCQPFLLVVGHRMTLGSVLCSCPCKSDYAMSAVSGAEVALSVSRPIFSEVASSLPQLPAAMKKQAAE